MKKFLKLALAIIIPLGIGFIGSYFTTPEITTWYTTLIKPSFNPPNWLFAPVWTLLFILMGTASYLVFETKKAYKKRLSLIIYGLQLSLNLAWSFLFFYLHNPLYSFLEILILWLVIALNIFFFYKNNKTAGYLLIPYILWVSFASILNLSIVLLN